VPGVLPLSTLTDAHSAYHEATRSLLAVSVMAVGLRYPVRQIARRMAPVS
jgi:hypothetical protein